MRKKMNEKLQKSYSLRGFKGMQARPLRTCCIRDLDLPFGEPRATRILRWS